MSKNLIDLTGKRFTRLTVLAYEGAAKWRVRCDCGTERVISGQSIRTGNTRSCGCLHHEGVSARMRVDLTGQRFGLMSVVAARGVDSKQKALWECVCDCGESKVVRGADLRSGATRSCGCLRRSETPTYIGVHLRLRRVRGGAKRYACADCGDRASDWSYDGNDPSEFVGPSRNSPALRYSDDISHYQPRCKPCHSRYDAAMRAERVA